MNEQEVAASAAGIDEAEEDRLFAAATAGDKGVFAAVREAGVGEVISDQCSVISGAADGAGGGAGAGEGAEADAGDAEGKAEAGAAGEAGEAAGAVGKAGAGAAAGADEAEGMAPGFVLEAFSGALSGVQDALMTDIGDLVVEAANGELPALSLREMAETEQNKPWIKAALAISRRVNDLALAPMREELAPVLEYVRQAQAREQREALLDSVAKGPDAIANAHDLADSEAFGTWYGKQTAEVKALGESAKRESAVRLLQLFMHDHPEGTGTAGAPARGVEGRSAEERAQRLGVVAASGKGGRGGAAQRPAAPVMAGAIDDEEADRQFAAAAARPGGVLGGG